MKQPFPVKMRRYEIIGGLVWLMIYGFLMGDILRLILGLFHASYTMSQLNALYFLCNFVITVLLFRRFLAYSLPVAADHFLRTCKAMLLGFCVYWLMQVGIDLLGQLLAGNVRRWNRAAAYGAAAAVFAAMHILPYIGDMSALSLCYNVLVYGLPSVALCVCYEYAGTIWAPIGLHMIINIIGMSAL